MPRGKASQSQAASQMAVDSDDETQGTQNLTQANKAMANLSREEKDTKLHDLIQFLLVMDQKKLPIKRQDINKHVLKEYSKTFPLMMEMAKEKLSEVFGFNLVELKGKLKKSYILVNQHETEHLACRELEEQKMGLLMVILATIFMNGNLVQEDQLFHMLQKLGIDTERPHPVFGDIKKLIVELGRHNYLEKTVIPNSDPVVLEYTWGQRAKLELTKRKCLEFVAEIYGMEDATQWTSQWQDIQRSEGLNPGPSGDQMVIDD